MELKERAFISSATEHSEVTITKSTYLATNGNEMLVAAENKFFTPNQIIEVGEFAPSMKSICAAMWTPEVIKRWEEYLKEQEEIMNP